VDLLAELARGGPALEFAAGTGRGALALAARGIAVRGIELSPHMAERMAAKPGADAVPVTIGDMTSTRVPGTFRLVYLVANTIMNVSTQDDQLAVFANAAAHLQPGGCFVVEVEVPQLRRVPPGQAGWVFTLQADHVGIETLDDTATQIAWSHHWIEVQGRLVRHSAPCRYVWPSELDLMAKITASGSGTAGQDGTGRPSPPPARARSRSSRNCRLRPHEHRTRPADLALQAPRALAGRKGRPGWSPRPSKRLCARGTLEIRSCRAGCRRRP